MPGSNNDINVLNRSGLWASITGLSQAVEHGESYVRDVSGGVYLGGEMLPFHHYYFLVDGIYPDYPVFLKSLSVVCIISLLILTFAAAN